MTDIKPELVEAVCAARFPAWDDMDPMTKKGGRRQAEFWLEASEPLVRADERERHDRTCPPALIERDEARIALEQASREVHRLNSELSSLREDLARQYERHAYAADRGISNDEDTETIMARDTYLHCARIARGVAT